MKYIRFAVVVALSGCASLDYTPPVEREIQKTAVIRGDYDTVWRRAVSWFAKNNIAIEKVEKESGLITAKYRVELDTRFLDCGDATTRGTLLEDNDRVLANLNVTLIPESSSYILVSVNIFGSFEIRNRDAWDGRVVAFEGRCVSTGVLENAIFQDLRT